MFANKIIPCNTNHIRPEIAIINTSTTFQLLAGSDQPGVNQDNNIDTSENLAEGDAGGAHAKSSGFDIEEEWGEGWEQSATYYTKELGNM
jgi:hypothetical protein